MRGARGGGGEREVRRGTEPARIQDLPLAPPLRNDIHPRPAPARGDRGLEAEVSHRPYRTQAAARGSSGQGRPREARRRSPGADRGRSPVCARKPAARTRRGARGRVFRMRKITFAEATLEALQGEFRRDEKTVHLGTDVAIPLRKEFGAARIRGTPIAESSFVGAAIGLAGSGFRPVVNLRMATFGFVALDPMVNQAAKNNYMFRGQARFPIVLRMTVGAGQSMAAQHSISPYPMYMNVPGLKIILPSTPYDGKGLLKTAIRDNNPVISFEHSALAGLI